MGRALRNFVRDWAPAWVVRRGHELFAPLAPADSRVKFKALDMGWSLEQLARFGFRPGLIVDVGAYVGDWSRLARRCFPDAAIVMVEAQPDKADALARACAEVGNATAVRALVGPEARPQVEFFAMETGSSVLSERTDHPREVIRVDMTTLDAATADAPPGPALLKLDTQGYELEVLRGATRLLERVEVLQTELSVLDFNEGAPALHEVIAFLAARDLVLFDLADITRKRSDGALLQLDALFVRRGSALRARVNQGL
ncbi:MAG: FkbM family methyltransferase [Planctomycetota bacterium]|nr:FkbM family methyltransferase [Planctomycetota bacterium]